MNHRIWQHTATTAISLFLFVWFSAVVLQEIDYTPFLYDSAIHIEVSDVLAHDLGKPITAYQNELFIAQTTGPALTLPGAILVRWLGPTIQTAGLTAALVSLLCFIWLLVRLQRFAGNNACWITLALTSIFLLQDPRWWTWMIGDMAAFLLFLVAASYACDTSLTWTRRHALFVLSAALALQARMTAIPLLAGAALYLLSTHGQAVWEGKQTVKQLGVCLLLDALILACSLLPFQLLEYSFYWQQHSIPYGTFLEMRLEFLSSNSAVGIGSLLQQPDVLARLSSNFSGNKGLLAGQLSRQYGLPVTFTWLFSLLPLAVAGASWQRHRNTALDKLLRCLSLSLLLVMLWFYLLASLVFERYTLQLVTLSLIILAMGLIRFGGGLPLLIALLACCWLLPEDTRQSSRERILFMERSDTRSTEARLYNQALVEASLYIENHPPRYPLAKFGWVASSRAINYLLPGTGNFEDAVHMISRVLQRQQDGSFAWQQPVDFTLVIENSSWRFTKTNPASRRLQNALMNACRQGLLFENKAIRIMECPFSSLQQHIPLQSDTPFVDTRTPWKPVNQ